MKNKTFLFSIAFLACICGIVAQEARVLPNTCLVIESGTTFDIGNGILVLESEANGDASLIDFGNLTTSGGLATQVERYLSNQKWHLISSPINNATAGIFTDSYLQYFTESTNEWTDISFPGFPMEIMVGYDLWLEEPLPTTIVFSGTTNTGPYLTGFTQSFEGWNLLGNPYPSSLDWDAVSIPPELNGAIWLYDPTIGESGDYGYYINGGGASNTTSQYIPSGQGFFVRATSGWGTLNLDNNDRAHGGQTFYKNTEGEAMLVLKTAGNNITSQTAIRFNENATTKQDRLYDVNKIITDSPDVPILFTKCENEKMAINTLPSIEGNEIVPLWFRAGMDGIYTIKATETETFENETPIYMHDLKNGTVQDMLKNPEYSFDYKTGGDRNFMVYFKELDNNLLVSDINIYAHNNILHVNFPVSNLINANFNAQILVFDLAGKKVFQTTTTEINNELPVNGNSSIYIVNVILEEEVVNGKVFIE